MVDIQLMADWPWEIPHQLLCCRTDCGLFASMSWDVHRSIEVVLRGSYEQSSKPVSGFASMLSYLYTQLGFRSV